MAIGDGCGWGEKAMEAADRATEGFITHLIEASARVRDTKALGCTLLEAVAAGHNAIISGKSDVYSAGTTTLIGGTVFPLPISVVPTAISTVKPSSSSSSLSAAAAAADAGPLSNAPPGAEFGVCLASIGDCKCFRWDVATKRVHDITAESRGNTTDPSDPGGRLGPYTAEGLPDTRNLRLHYATCHTNDLLIFCSDGVHDNLDCASLGITPGTLADELDGMTWPEAARANRSATEKVRAAFYDARLDTLINEQYVREGPRPSLESPGASSSSAAKAAPTPADIADYIIEYCLRTTYPSRKYLETHPGLPLPQGDYRHYPGKMDHATVVVIRVDTPGN